MGFKINVNEIMNRKLSLPQITDGKIKISIDKDVDRSKLCKILNGYDSNGTGVLEKDEIKNLHDDVGNKLTREKVEQLLIEGRNKLFKSKSVGKFSKERRAGKTAAKRGNMSAKTATKGGNRSAKTLSEAEAKVRAPGFDIDKEKFIKSIKMPRERDTLRPEDYVRYSRQYDKSRQEFIDEHE